MRASQDSCHFPVTFADWLSPAEAKLEANMRTSKQKHSDRVLVIILVAPPSSIDEPAKGRTLGRFGNSKSALPASLLLFPEVKRIKQIV
jgi:hypothetical protein